jgi:hypothetical protein
VLFYELVSALAAAFFFSCLFYPKFGRIVARLIDRHAAGLERAHEAYWTRGGE